ncbi:hypothetical protein GCM10028820_19450 [Tessaracoccus terricola]
MRVLVASDAMAGLSPRAASETIGTAFAEQGAQVAVIPIGSGGDALADALSTMDPDGELQAPGSIGEALESMAAGKGTLYLDLTALDPPTAAELVSAAPPEVVAAATERLAGRQFVGVVPADLEDSPLTGLSGAVAELGRRRGAELAETIADDGRAEAWAAALGVDPGTRGAGALGGVGAVVIAAGGSVSSGLELCLDGHGASGVMARADVVVTGAAQLDFHAVGGPVVKRLAQLAEEALRPIVVVAGRTFVSARELRLAGIEAAYAVLPGAGDEVPTREQLAGTAAKVAATWRW